MKKAILVISVFAACFLAGCSEENPTQANVIVQERTAEQQLADIKQVGTTFETMADVVMEMVDMEDLSDESLFKNKLTKKMAYSLAKKYTAKTNANSVDTTITFTCTTSNNETFSGTVKEKATLSISNDERSGSANGSYSLSVTGNAGTSLSMSVTFSMNFSTASDESVTAKISITANASAAASSFDIAIKNATISATITLEPSEELRLATVTVSCPIEALGGTYRGKVAFKMSMNAAEEVSFSDVSGNFYYGNTKVGEIRFTDDYEINFIDSNGELLWNIETL